ncbi:MAG: FAD binding domain-containing protein [Acidobacteriota bacterium]|jgi:xanthine dehydrogenase YagS FAD-binding subunit
MNNFEYVNATSLKEAAAALASSWTDAVVLAGGTDLLGLMKDYVMSPKRLVNIKNIKELGGITKSGAGLRIGATVTFDELANSALVRQGYPSLYAAVMGVTSPQIRNMGTVGGDLCQRPRCWYFRLGHGVLGEKDGKSLVADGENKYHAIFPEGRAHFVSASSLGPALVALGARVKLVSAAGSRELEAAKFFVAPQSNEAREIALLPNEILTEVVLPAAGKNATYEVRQKDALDWPLVTASVNLTMKGTAVTAANIVLGHVGPTPRHAAGAEQALIGKAVTADLAMAVGEAAVKGAKALSQNAYKIQLARVAVKRALLEAAGVKA